MVIGRVKKEVRMAARTKEGQDVIVISHDGLLCCSLLEVCISPTIYLICVDGRDVKIDHELHLTHDLGLKMFK